MTTATPPNPPPQQPQMPTSIIMPDNPDQLYRLAPVTASSGQVLHQGGIFKLLCTIPKGYQLTESEVFYAYGVTPDDASKFKHFSMANKQERYVLKPVEGAAENKHIRNGKCYALYEIHRQFLHLYDDTVEMAPAKVAPPPKTTEPSTFTPYANVEDVKAVAAVGQRWRTTIKHRGGESSELIHIRIGTLRPATSDRDGIVTCEYGAMVQGELTWCPSDHPVTLQAFALCIVRGQGGMLS